MGYRYVTLSLAAAALATGCEPVDDGFGVQAVDDPTGTWVSDCYSDNAHFDRISVSIRYTMSFKDGMNRTDIAAFFDQNCGKSFATLTEELSYRVLDGTGLEGRWIDYVMRDSRLRPADAAAAHIMNQYAICGKTDWSEYGSIPMLGATCWQPYATGGQWPDKGQLIEDLFLIEPAGDGATFYWGLNDYTMVLGDRPRRVDRNLPFHRVHR